MSKDNEEDSGNTVAHLVFSGEWLDKSMRPEILLDEISGRRYYLSDIDMDGQQPTLKILHD